MDMKCHTRLFFFFHVHIPNIPTAWEKRNKSELYYCPRKNSKFSKIRMLALLGLKFKAK